MLVTAILLAHLQYLHLHQIQLRSLNFVIIKHGFIIVSLVTEYCTQIEYAGEYEASNPRS